jgi:enterochelin esterase-like enzyme
MNETKAIIDKLEENGNPIIEGNRAMIYWHGGDPPVLASDFSFWESGEPIVLSKVGKNLWVHELELPSDAYIEYAFFKDKTRVLDPLNRRVIPNGLGNYNNYFGMPDYKPTEWINHTQGIPHGKVFSAALPTYYMIAGKYRKVYFYQPPVNEPVPLIVVYDGAEYNFRARLSDMLDNLIAANRVQPAALAMVCNSPKIRPIEYCCTDLTVQFILQILIPTANQKLNLLDPSKHPGSFGILGSSMGGLMSFYTALRAPQIFGKALAQSSAFTFNNFDFVVWDLLKGTKAKKVNFWIDCGKYEMLLASNRNMTAAMQKRGWKFVYREHSGGHNYPSWRDNLPDGLEYLFGTGNAERLEK